MTALSDLVRWIITYSVSNGFWHFLAVVIIVRSIARIAAFVRVDVKAGNRSTKTEEKAKAQ